MPSMQKPSKPIYDMNIRPIRTEDNYRAAMRQISAFFDNEPEPTSEDGEHFEILLTLAEAYEVKHFPIDLPDPVATIKFRMDQTGLTAKDLEPMIGRSNRVYEILNRKRPLALPMIRKLHDRLGIPAESLIRPSLDVPAG